MQYENLEEGLRTKLEDERVAYARYSSNTQDVETEIDDAILLSEDSEMDTEKLHGYVLVPVHEWFEYATDGKSDEEAVKMVKEALGIFE